MKKITTGIFAAIALLTMSFTVAEQAGAFEDRTSLPETCLANVDAMSFTTSTGSYEHGVSACNSIPLGECADVTTAPTNINCEGEDVLCCAKLETGCPGDKRKIQRIICKE